MYHPESDSLFEVFGQQALEDLYDSGADGAMCNEVTGLRWAEQAFATGAPPNPPENLLDPG